MSAKGDSLGDLIKSYIDAQVVTDPTLGRTGLMRAMGNAIIDSIYPISATYRANTYAGYGNASNNKIPYWTNVVTNTLSSYVTIANNNTVGNTFTILQAGLYFGAISFNTDATASGFSSGFSLNSTQLTTGLGTINASDRLPFSINASSSTGASPFLLPLAVNDVVRPHTGGQVPTTASSCNIILTLVALI